MKLSMVVALGSALVCSVALASPQVLTGAELDTVAAGTNGDYYGLAAACAYGDQGIAVNALDSEVTAAGAVADNDALATNGDDNTVVKNDANIAIGGANAGSGNDLDIVSQEDAIVAINQGEHGVINIPIDVKITTNTERYDEENEIEEIEDGSVAVIGYENDVTVHYDASTVEAEADGGDIKGVVARTAEVADSFNFKMVTTCVDVTITDSFNTTTNSSNICGQDDVSAIVNANSLLGFQAAGVNLNTASATAEMASSLGDTSASVPIISGNAIAIALTDQVVVNNTVFGLF